MERQEVDTVRLQYNIYGQKKPRAIKYQDGFVEIIDYIVDEKLAAAKTGGQGVRYTCKIMDRTKYLFHDSNGSWFVEAEWL